MSARRYFSGEDLHLGATQSGKALYIDSDVRKTHMHVLGASGRGKSFFLEYLIRQDIRNSDGLCLIDPHGELYRKVVTWCAEHSYLSWDRLILLDASAPGWAFGFNPLYFADADTSYCVDSMVNACAQVWGGENTASTPLLKEVLRGVFHVLAEKGLTLLEANYLIDHTDELKPLRRLLTQNLKDPIVREQWERWNKTPVRDLGEQFGSSKRRLMEFLSAQVIRVIVGHMEPVIDMRRVMDEGAVVLVNLEARAKLSDFNARTLGTLLTNDLFLKANDRPEGSRPFYLYIDECGRFLNESIQRILDESRKRGLHLILANQHLEQLKQAGEMVYSAVMTDAQTKVIFGGLFSNDAETMVKEVFLDLNLEEPKESLTRRVAVGQEKIILRGGSTSRSSTTSRGTSKGTAFGSSTGSSYGSSIGTILGSSESKSQVLYPDDVGMDVERPRTEAWGLSQGETTTSSSSYSESTSTMASESESESESTSAAEMDSWTESFQTIYADAVGGHFTLEEQRYKKVGWLKKQPKQLALLVQPDYSLVPFRVATVRQPNVTREDVEAFVEKRFAALSIVSREEDVMKYLEAKGSELKRLAAEHGTKQKKEGRVAQTEEFDPWGNG